VGRQHRTQCRLELLTICDGVRRVIHYPCAKTRSPLSRGAITGIGTALGGMLHTFPFLLPRLSVALRVAYAVVVFELLAIAFIRYKFMKTPLVTTVVQVIVGGGIVFAIGLWLGRIGAAG